MLFTSMTFLGMFLPIVCLLYLITKKELHNSILLIASIIFYAWGEPKYLAIMLLTIIITYVGTLLIEKYPMHKRLTITLSIMANLSFLIYFKYFNFIIHNINEIFHGHINTIAIIMPIGISFYTFHCLSYLIDVYREEAVAQRDIYKLALYITLFPALIAGPIVKYHDIANQIDNREVTFDKVKLGVQRFIIGLSKKMLIANTMGAIVDKIFIQSPDTFSHLVAWIGALAYTFQLYFDFSGYSDMAIGLCLIFGFVIPENFIYPYISKSISEFWRRWHISLSTWFRDYLFYPLMRSDFNVKITSFFSKLVEKKKAKKIATSIILVIVWSLIGFWHGAEWTFVIFGLYHGTFIILEMLTGWDKESDKKIITALQHIYTILVFVLGFVIFRSENITYAIAYLKNMFGFANIHNVVYALSYYIDNIEIITFMAALLCSVSIFSNMLYIKQERKVLRSLVNIWLIALFIFSTLTIVASGYNPFIYFRF